MLNCFLAGVVLVGFDEVELAFVVVAAEVVAWEDDEEEDDEEEEWAVMDEVVDWLELSPSDWLIGCTLLMFVASAVDKGCDCSTAEDISLLFYLKLKPKINFYLLNFYF